MLFLVLMVYAAWDQAGEKEIALVIGEPWKDMRQRSSANIGPAIAGHFAFSIPESDARLRFIDPQYRFITPKARFLTVNFERDGSVGAIRMSPQIEPLLLEDTLKVVLNLQDQWRGSGWKPIYVRRDPPFADTPQSRARIQGALNGEVTYWQAGDKYQAMMVVGRFKDNKHPTEERYLITLSLAKPWMKP
jgi:hypothetical protein